MAEPLRHHPRPAFEPDAIDVARVVVGVSFVVAVLAICGAAVSLLFRSFVTHYEGRPPGPAAIAAPTVRGPALQPAPAAELAALRAEEGVKLHTYRWIDREHGVVQIPIERAMQLLVDRGGAPGASQ